MIDVKDEILETEPRYRIRDKNGNILFDDLSFEMITPIIQPGTPLNKNFFDSIKRDISSCLNENSKVDRYNKAIISEQTRYAIERSNLLAGTWEDVSNNHNIARNGLMTATVNSYASGDYTSQYAFTSTGWCGDDYKENSLILDLGKSIKINTFSLGISCEGFPDMQAEYFSNFTIHGSNNNSDWINLHTMTTYDSSVKEFKLENIDFYRYYKFTINQTSARQSGIRNLQVIDYYKEANILEFSNNIESYFENQRFLIEIPANTLTYDRAYVKINNLEEKVIEEKLISGSKYELVYNGESFNARSVENEIEEIKNAIINLGGSI